MTKRGYRVSPAVDLLTGWDLDSSSGIKRLWDLIKKDQPQCIIMSPVCRAFSVAFASNWSRVDEGERSEVERKGIAFLHLCCEIALYQISLGRDFILEHPQSA
eukprot:8660204-Pyramimonas_sp.AAC.1